MYEENGQLVHKLSFSEKEGRRIEQNAEDMGMDRGEYMKYAIRVFEQREQLKEVLDE